MNHIGDGVNLDFRRGMLVYCLLLAGCAATGANAPLFRDGVYIPSAESAPDSPTLQAIPSSSFPAREAATSEHVERVTRPVPSVPVGERGAPHRPARNVEDKVILNFKDAEIQAVIGALSRFLGRNFLMDPRVKGQITLISDGQIDSDTAYSMLLSALRMRGFTIVDVGNVSRVVPVADAKTQGGAVNGTAAGGGIATRTFHLSYENADALVTVLKPMIAAESSITAYSANNTIVITDYIDNLERIARIIDSIDTPTSLDTEVVKVYNGIATDIAGLANDILQQQTSGGGPGATASRAPREIAVLADPRSNSIVIRSSSPARTALARDLIVKLDNAQEDPGNLHVVYLRNARASYLSGVLRGLLSGESGDTALGSGDAGARAALGAGGMLSGAGTTTPGSNTANTGSSSSTGNSKAATGGSQRFATSGSATGQQGGNGQGSGTAFSVNGVTVQADASTNTLLISAPDPMYRSLRRVIDMLDQRRAQVLVESLIVEVTEGDSSALGIQWMRKGGNFIAGTNLGGSGLKTSATNTIDLLPEGLNLGVIDGTINLPGIGQITNLEALARALQTKDGVNILSTPNLLTLDNESASIMVGKTVPFVSGQYITSGSGNSDNPFQTVERQDVGLKLQIRPQISEGGTVKLDVYQEVSSIDDQTTSTAGIVTNKRAFDTSVLLDDGQIMVLGGLLDDRVNSSTSAVPILGSLPVLGRFFRYDSRQRSKTNLMVFLRPYVIRDARAGHSITQGRYDFMRAAESRVQPEALPLQPDIPAPILPPADIAIAGHAATVDLRPGEPPHDRQAASTATSAAPQSHLGATPDSESARASAEARQATLQAAPIRGSDIMQVADVRTREEAVQITTHLREHSLNAYIIKANSIERYAVRVDVPHDSQAADRSVETLRNLGYRPELVVTP